MAKQAFIVGGRGQVGAAAARRLLERGWAVTVASRNRPETDDAAWVRLDREQEPLDAAAGFDVVIDVIPYELQHARQLLDLRGKVGSVIAISSASVYVDREGRTLDEASGPHDFPDLPVPIPESQRTVPPGEQTYSTKKVAVERALLGQDDIRATVIRPCAIYGVGSALPREWFFVKRVLDRRRVVPLAYGGRSRFHTTSAENLAELIWLAAERPGTRVLNCGDPDPPTVLEIARTIARALEHEWTEVLLPGPPTDAQVGKTPWSTPKPIVVDMLNAELEVRYRPVTSYERAVVPLLRRLVDDGFGSSEYLDKFFDYEAEDDYVRNLAS